MAVRVLFLPLSLEFRCAAESIDRQRRWMSPAPSLPPSLPLYHSMIDGSAWTVIPYDSHCFLNYVCCDWCCCCFCELELELSTISLDRGWRCSPCLAEDQVECVAHSTSLTLLKLERAPQSSYYFVPSVLLMPDCVVIWSPAVDLVLPRFYVRRRRFIHAFGKLSCAIGQVIRTDGIKLLVHTNWLAHSWGFIRSLFTRCD